MEVPKWSIWASLFQSRIILSLDPDFLPLQRFNEAFLADAHKSVGIAVERANGEMTATETFIHGTDDLREAEHYYIDRLVKTMLWIKGGYKIYVRGDEDTCNYLKSIYCTGSKQEFDRDFMARIYERPFEIVLTDTLPRPRFRNGPASDWR